ncbi:hypothetical protein OQA88_965 [Cercophora sp. LCS_1]
MVDPITRNSLTPFSVVADVAIQMGMDRVLFFILGPWRHGAVLWLTVVPMFLLPPWTAFGLTRLLLIYAYLPSIFSFGGLVVLRCIDILTVVVLPRLVATSQTGYPNQDQRLMAAMTAKGGLLYFAVTTLRRYVDVGVETIIEDHPRQTSVHLVGNSTRVVVLPNPVSYHFFFNRFVGLSAILLVSLVFLSFFYTYTSDPIRRAAISAFISSFFQRLLRWRLQLKDIFKALNLLRRIFLNNRATSGPSAYRCTSLPKNHIRLATLHPGTTNAIQCSLQPIHLASLPPYEAISHRWNPADPTAIVLTPSPTEPGQTLPVSSAIYNLLLHLRHPTTPRTIWLDTICIGQSSTTEKEIQVSHMTDIYRNATRVIAWLGSSPLSHGGLAYLSALGTDQVPTPTTWRGKLRLNTAWSSAVEIAGNPWFTRAWVVQGVACAQSLILITATETADWRGVADGLIQFRVMSQDPERLLQGGFDKSLLKRIDAAAKGCRHATALENVRSYYRGGDGDAQLGVLLKYSLGVECTEKRDRIYALLGLARERGVMDVEYGTGTTTGMVFARAAAAVLKESLDGWYLSGRGYVGGVLEEEVPSWVPDWMSRTFVNHVVQGEGYMAGTGFASVVDTEEVGNGILRMKGVVVDKITLIGSIWPWPDAETPSCSANLGLFRRVAKCRREESVMLAGPNELKRRYPWLHELEEALWRTRMGNRAAVAWAQGQHRRPSDAEWLGVRAVVMEQDSGAGFDFARLCAAWGSLGLGIGGRRLVVTEKGYLGVVPPLSEEGDSICVFFGASTPTVLREGKELDGRWNGSFTVVGSCYVHGVMDGELGVELRGRGSMISLR